MDRSTMKMLARAAPVLARLPSDCTIVFIEVGVNRGQLSEHLLKARPLLEWHGIDPWWHAPDHASKAYVSTGDGHAWQTHEVSQRCYRETLERVRPFGRRANVGRMASPGAAGTFALHFADAVFIDADHSYEAVKADLSSWWPIVKTGGWIGGHDYGNTDDRFDFSGVNRAVDEFVAARVLELELDGGATWFARKP